jgi:nucleoside-diphosphate-sugar epimerase
MKVIITGGSGIIGRVLTQMLIAEGHEVIMFTRFS